MTDQEGNNLPKTVDGVSITVGMRVFWISDDPTTLKEGKIVNTIDDTTVWGVDGDGEEYAMPDDFGLYSTRAAAEAAKKG